MASYNNGSKRYETIGSLELENKLLVFISMGARKLYGCVTANSTLHPVARLIYIKDIVSVSTIVTTM